MKKDSEFDRRVLDVFADRVGDLISKKQHETKKELKDLAKEMGMSSGILSTYQNGGAEAGITKLKRIADYFDVSCDFLLGGYDCPIPDAESVHRYTGLSNSTIEKLVTYNGSAEVIRVMMNELLGCNAFVELVKGLNYFLDKKYYLLYFESKNVNEKIKNINDKDAIEYVGKLAIDEEKTVGDAIERLKEGMAFGRWMISDAMSLASEELASKITYDNPNEEKERQNGKHNRKKK